MTDLIDTLRAIIRDELARLQQTELGVVSQVFPRTGDSDKSNHQVNLTLRRSGVELHRVPVLVGRLGVSALPNVGDLMAVAFIGGELNAPIALGCLYDHENHPPVAEEHEVVYLPPDDAQSGVKRVHVELQDGSTLTLEDDKLEVAMGGTSFLLEKDGDVTIKSPGAIRLTADGDIELEASGAVKLSAQGDVKVSGVSVTVEGQAEAKVKAAQVGLAGNIGFSPS